MPPRIRSAQQADREGLLALWERSVRATHGFLTEEDIAFYKPLVAAFLAADTTELWVLTDGALAPLGFVGLSADGIEALFLDPAIRRQGHGRLLVEYAQEHRPGALAVDVNEENADARGFYEALGFVVVGRSPVDGTGRPHPLLHMRREAPGR
jgi:putative acetyltransferase